MADDDEDLLQMILAQLAASAPGANNSILAGAGTLIRTMIQSPNYVPGVSGWTINKDGSAEFNNLTVRGTFAGTDFVINSAGIFFYSGVPALGNLILALTNTAGTDSFGNVYIQGITIGNASGIQVLLKIVSGVQAAMQFPTNNANENVASNITANAIGGVTPTGFLQFVISGPKTNVTGAQDWTQILFNSANYGNTSDASMDFNYIGSGGGVHNYANMDGSGFNIVAGSIVAAQPGAQPQVPATWTNIPLVNSFAAGSNNGFIDVPQVRMMADNKNLQFKGTLACPATGSATVWGNIPSGFPNANLGGIFGMVLIANLTGGTVDHIELHNNGNLSLGNVRNGLNFDISGVMATQ
jgi:hypothetical protein